MARPFIFGETQVHPRPIGDLLTLQATRSPNAPALTFEGITLTRLQLEQAANRRARALALLGVRESDFVALALPNGPAFHATAFAIWKLGATPAPLPPQLPDHELTPILDLLRPALAVGVEAARAPGHLCAPADAIADATLPDGPLPSKMAAFQKAMTSGGSTGRPKVIVDHAPAALDPDVISLGMTLDDVILMPGPLYHNGPFGITHRALCRGAHVIEMGRFEPAEALALVARHGVRWAYMVPTMMRRIWALPAAEREAHDLASLEMVVHMAAACSPWLKRAWIDWLGPDRIWEVYAGAERMGAVCIGGRDWLAHPGSVGRPDPTRTRIVDAEGRDRAPGEVGEILFRPPGGRGSTYHYLGARAPSVGDWESYGDLGHLDADGFLYIADRRTDMFVSGGANIYPAEVEAAIDSHPGVTASVVVGLPDDDLGQRLHAIIEPRDMAEAPSRAGLERHLSERLARYKLPYSVEFVAGPLRDEAGKVRRSALREPRIAAAAAGEIFVRLRGPVAASGG